MPYDCFLSYASDDVVIAEAVHRALTAAGIAVWFDRGRLQPGFDWHREIEAACESVRVVLPLLTPRWKQSEWTKYETYGAEAVIPLLAEGQFNDVATPPLRRVQAALIETTGDAAIPRLVAAIRRRLGEPPLDRTECHRRLSHLHYRPTEHFVGRERDLDRLHEQLHVSPTAALTQGGVQAVTALGGIGKTTLARMYAEKFWRMYQQVLWVDARLGYESEFARLLDVLRPDLATSLRGFSNAERAVRAQQELEDLSCSHPLMFAALLIIDNVADEETAAAWIPRSGKLHTIITSRFANWRAISVLQIDVLQPKPAIELLLRRSGTSDLPAVPWEERAACDVLAAKLGYLPLALEQAAAYIRAQGNAFGFTNYLRLYAEEERALLSMPVRGTTEYPESVFVTWRATVARLPKGARAMLRLAAFLAPTEIPLALFQDSAQSVRVLGAEFLDALPDEVGADAGAELSVRCWRGALVDYSMATASSAGTLTVHGLVQAVEREQLEPETRQRWMMATIDLFVRHAPAYSHEFEQWVPWRVLLPHAQVLYAEALAAGAEMIPRALLRGMTSFLDGQGRYAEALPIARLALSQDERMLGAEDPATLGSVNTLAGLLKSQGVYPEAEALYRRALATSQRRLGPEHPRTLVHANNLAGLLESQGANVEAESLYRRTLDASEQTLGPDDLLTLAAVNNLAHLKQSLGANVEAERLHRRALERFERLFGPDHPHTLTSINNLAIVLGDQGAQAEAEKLHRRALVARERVLGPDHPDTLASVNNLAGVLDDQGGNSEAESLYRRALGVSERVLGLEKPADARQREQSGRVAGEKGGL